MRTIHHQILNPPERFRGIFLLRSWLTLGFFLYLGSQIFSQPKLQVKENKKNFHYINRGEVVILNYEVLNVGNETLIIQDAEVSCSCTSVDFPKQPIAPGQSDKITVRFNTLTVYGRQDRVVKIKSNAPGKEILLHYKGEVSKNKPE